MHQRRRAENRLGFALQLCLVRYPGRVLRSDERPPPALITFVAEQIDVDPGIFSNYAKRDETRREHALLLVRQLKLLTFNGLHFREIVRWLIPVALENPKGSILVGAGSCILICPLSNESSPWPWPWGERNDTFSTRSTNTSASISALSLMDGWFQTRTIHKADTPGSVSPLEDPVQQTYWLSSNACGRYRPCIFPSRCSILCLWRADRDYPEKETESLSIICVYSASRDAML